MVTAGEQADLALVARDLRIAIGRVSSRLRRLYADAADDATFTELAVLRRLEREGPTTPSALANHQRVTAQWMGIVLTALARRGLITRTPDSADRRRVIVAITDAGRRTLSARDHAIVERLERVIAQSFDAGERATFAEVTPLLERLADEL